MLLDQSFFPIFILTVKMNIVIVDRTYGMIGDIEKTSKNKWCWSWMELSFYLS